VDLPLTKDGKQAALLASQRRESEALGSERDAQRKADAELPNLIGDVRSGRYVEALIRGVQLLSAGKLSRSQVAAIHRQLLEAYTALGAKGRATESCQLWLENDANAVLNPVLISPKVLAACPAKQPPAKPGAAASASEPP
jgi:hypothetical protein